MRRVWLAAIATVVPLGLVACDGGGGDVASSPPPEATPVPVAVAPANTGATPATQPFNAPTVAGQPGAPVGSVPPELIPSVNPQSRLTEVRRGRPDPFVLVPTTPSIVRSPQPPGATAAAPTTTPLIPRRSVDPDAPTGSRPGGNGQLAPIPNLVPSAPVIPPPPPTDLARAVRVLGVIQIGSIPHAIVQAPNEPSSRYVRAGQVLANGQVVVRRIIVTGADPIVVLEQNGVEISTAVGEGGAPTAAEPGAVPPAPPAQPTAALPTERNGAIARS